MSRRNTIGIISASRAFHSQVTVNGQRGTAVIQFDSIRKTVSALFGQDRHVAGDGCFSAFMDIYTIYISHRGFGIDGNIFCHSVNLFLRVHAYSTVAFCLILRIQFQTLIRRMNRNILIDPHHGGHSLMVAKIFCRGISVIDSDRIHRIGKSIHVIFQHIGFDILLILIGFSGDRGTEIRRSLSMRVIFCGGKFIFTSARDILEAHISRYDGNRCGTCRQTFRNFYGTFQIIFDCRIVITGIVKLIRQSVQSFTDQILIGRLVGIGIQTAVPGYHSDNRSRFRFFYQRPAANHLFWLFRFMVIDKDCMTAVMIYIDVPVVVLSDNTRVGRITAAFEIIYMAAHVRARHGSSLLIIPNRIMAQIQIDLAGIAGKTPVIIGYTCP